MDEEEQQTLDELIAFIEAHGGKLAPYRGWRPSEVNDQTNVADEAAGRAR
jgi:hypothetical protein